MSPIVYWMWNRLLMSVCFSVHIGNSQIDQVLMIMLGTPMFVGGFIGCLLDNTMPGKHCSSQFSINEIKNSSNDCRAEYGLDCLRPIPPGDGKAVPLNCKFSSDNNTGLN